MIFTEYFVIFLSVISKIRRPSRKESAILQRQGLVGWTAVISSVIALKVFVFSDADDNPRNVHKTAHSNDYSQQLRGHQLLLSRQISPPFFKQTFPSILSWRAIVNRELGNQVVLRSEFLHTSVYSKTHTPFKNILVMGKTISVGK